MADDHFPPLMPVANKGATYGNPKIRIGYLCGEFRNQATSILMTGVYETHDKSCFEIFAFDNGWDDGSELRHRIEGAFNQIIDITTMTDEVAARLIADMKIDILVNLNGYFGEGRQNIFAHRAAPIQVNYLGFPGTMGAPYMDYLIADRIVIPEASQVFYTEKIAYLPNCYQPNDSKRVISDKQFTRQELGLPETGFVFCCFNNNYKITPQTFDGWMRILNAVEGSVLWLLEDNASAAQNLRNEAIARGIAPERLIFAPRMSLPEHLSRHRQANLFLDTLPYNAHTTASDALWAGLPLLTCYGTTFAGRVAASLLKTIDLLELITQTPEQYEALAIELALNPDKLQTIKEKLATNRATSPLFDTQGFTKDLEKVYLQMHNNIEGVE
jgi:predicted O-linked N-acetylglucosamine transferase (SPINDLY family)